MSPLRVRRRFVTKLAFLGFLFLAGGWLSCGKFDVTILTTLSSQRAAVVDGQTDPSQLQFDLTPTEQNAIVANRYLHGEWYQGGSANVISDRMVISAAHCVLANVDEWENGGAPVAISPAELTFDVGPDTNQSLCTLAVSQIQIHPEAHMDSVGWMHNDVSVIVLTDSIIETCPQITPIAVNRDTLPATYRDAEMLQGGYGSLDRSYNFSPIRYWSKLTYLGPYSGTPDSLIWFGDAGFGSPSFGDSGSAILHRDDAGRLQILGVSSMFGNMGEDTIHGFTRIDLVADLIDAIAANIEVCDHLPIGGACEDTTRLNCVKYELEKNACHDDGKTCEVVDGTAQCVLVVPEKVPDPESGCQNMGHANTSHFIFILLFALYFHPRRAASPVRPR